MRFTKLTSTAEVKRFIETSPKLLAVDVETTGLNFKKDKLLSISIAYSENDAVFIPASLINGLAFLSDKILIFHNNKFDRKFLYQAGVNTLGAVFFDTVYMHHMLDENASHALDDIIQENWGDDYKDKFWSKYKEFDQASEQEQIEYSCKDVIYTYRLFHMLKDKCFKNKKLLEHLHKLSDALIDTELFGINLDINALYEQQEILKGREVHLLVNMAKSVAAEIGQWEMLAWNKEIEKRKTEKGRANVQKPRFNFESGKQLGELLYDILGLPEQKNKSNRRTVDDTALQALESKHMLLPLMREYRDVKKTQGTYIEGMLERQINNTIYPEFNVCGTVTGRISSKNPNLQNIPTDNTIRSFFIAAPSMQIISADYGQIEICLAAHFSEDPLLLELLATGKSMHDLTAERLGIERQHAKTLNFAILYGASKYKVAKIFNCTEDRGQEIIDKFFDTYKGLKRIIEFCHNQVAKGMPIVSPFGRERHFNLTGLNFWERERAKRQSFNSLIQGTAGDICNRAFYLTNDYLKQTAYGRTLFPVHDEIIVEAQATYVGEVSRKLAEIMKSVGQEIKLIVPLEVKVSEPKRCWTK